MSPLYCGPEMVPEPRICSDWLYQWKCNGFSGGEGSCSVKRPLVGLGNKSGAWLVAPQKPLGSCVVSRGGALRGLPPVVVPVFEASGGGSMGSSALRQS